ncbi:MAG TPA: PAS domain S-box protein [Acidimicrobiales bacterium]|nr:PAS domain S-box protein [Acidimicrobiales bacterium]
MAPQSLGDPQSNESPIAGARERAVGPRWTLSTYLVVPVMLFALAASANLVYQRRVAADDARRSALADARFAASIAARAVAVTVEHAVTQVESTGAECIPNFATSAPFSSGHIDIVRADGTVACSSLPSTAPAEYAAAPWLAPALAGRVLQAPVLDVRTGRQSLFLGAPIASGALVVVIDVENLGAGLSTAFGGPRRLEFLVMAGADKTVVARTGNPRRWIGESLQASPLAAIRSTGETTGLDGVVRYYGRADVEATGWVLLAGARRSDALAEATRLSNRQVAITLIGFVFFLAAGWVIYRRVARPIEELSSGVRAATHNVAAAPIQVSGPAEVTRLVDDFNRLLAAARGEREVTSQVLSVVDSLPDAIVGISTDGSITSWSGGAEQMFGYTAEESIGQPGASFVHPGQEAELAVTMAHALLGERIHAYETKVLHKSGGVVEVEASAAPVYDAEGHIIAVSVSIRDLTQRKRAEADRRGLEARVRRAERINEQERELRLLEDRERIGRDLHDTVIQRLYATGVTLEALANRMADEDLKVRLGRAVDEIDTTIREIRSAIYAMESGAYGRTREAFEDVVEAASEALGTRPTLQFIGIETNIPPHVVDQMLAVLRESLSNVTRHAGASRVQVAINVSDEIVLSVTDDGVGVDEGSASDHPGLGIASMRARAERLGGRFTMQRVQTGGTCVEWRVPREGRSNR